MRSHLPLLATELAVNERTLRRAAARGTLRCRRPSARGLVMPAGERDYLRTHWPLLESLSRALRTEPNVRLAVLYGSAARGDDRPDSDLDLLVDFRAPAPLAANALSMRLQRNLDREVDLARLDRVRESSPLLLLQALDEGRVLVDRDNAWAGLLAARPRARRAATAFAREERSAAAAALAEGGREMADERRGAGRARKEADESRVARRLRRLPAQRDALALALQPFAGVRGGIDERRWREAFESSDPDVIRHVWEVTGGYQALVNHYVEMLHAGAKLAGLPVAAAATRPPAPQLIDAIRDDGGLSAAKARAVAELYRTRNRLQHASPDIEADEVRAQVTTLLKTVRGLLQDYADWLGRHGIDLRGRGG